MENDLHAICVGLIVFFAALAGHAAWWLWRCDRLIKALVEALLQGSSSIQFATDVIVGQRARIAELEAGIERLRSSNIIELSGSRQTRSCREPRK